MLRSPCYIFSDTHLGAEPPGVERSLLSFMRHLAGRAGSLVINGDLFDFWFEWRTVIPRGSFRVLAALAELRESGTDIVLIAGNHDCWGGDILRDDVGVRYMFGPWSGDLAGWRARVEHGDGLRPEGDRRYRMLRRLLRNGMAMGAFRLLHPDVGSRIASGSSRASREHRAADDGVEIRSIASRQLHAHPGIDLLVYGHSHVAHLERLVAAGDPPHPADHARGGEGVYANAGSWLHDPTYVVVTPERIELRRWDGSAEGDRLHAIDRRAEKALP